MILTSKKINELDLEFVKEYLKVDYEDEDTLIQSLILAAQSYVNTMLGYKVTERWSTTQIPDELTIACLMIISNWFDNRQLQTTGTLGAEISFAVSAIIDAHKDQLKDYEEEVEVEDGTTIIIGGGK